jgi:Yip1 domain
MNLVERARMLIVHPRHEWRAIDAEPQTVHGLYTRYVMILSAIPAICGFIGFSLVGVGVIGATYRMPMAAGVAHLVVGYVLSLGGVYLLALLIDALAPTFGGRKSFIQALKVAAFSPTPLWLAGIFNVIPSLWIIGVPLSFYSLYLLYLGLPIAMKAPQDKAVTYIAVVIMAAIVLVVVVKVVIDLTLPAPIRGF